MLTNLLLKTFIKENEDFSNNEVRKNVGYLSGIVGVILNLILFAIKLSIGFIVSSISVTADAFNNLTDVASSLVTIVGFKFSNAPPDKEHPYGHGRVEYLSALIVAFLVMLVGFQFIKASVDKILNPEPMIFQLVPFIILLLSIVLKAWLGLFNKKLADKIDSTTLMATAADSLGDVLTTSVVVISLFISKFTDLAIDGYIGLIVSVLIIYAGYTLVRETIDPLIGEAPSKELIKSIKSEVLSYDYITGVHDLLIHNYGPGRTMATIHAEFNSNIEVLTIHEVIDTAEREIGEKYNIDLLIHMDPISIDNDDTADMRDELNLLIEKHPEIKSVHDVRIVEDPVQNMLVFDIIIDGNKLTQSITEETIKELLIKEVNICNQELNCIVSTRVQY